MDHCPWKGSFTSSGIRCCRRWLCPPKTLNKNKFWHRHRQTFQKVVFVFVFEFAENWEMPKLTHSHRYTWTQTALHTHTLVSVDSGIAEHIDSLSVTLVDQPIDRKDGRLASWTIRKIVCLFGGFGRMTIVRAHVKQEYVARRLYCLVRLTFGYWLFSLMGIVC